MEIKNLLKKSKQRIPKDHQPPIIEIDYSDIEKRILLSMHNKCPVCGKSVIDIESIPGLSLKDHLSEQTDDAHKVFEIMEL